MEKLVGSPYGNYVVQKALAVTEHELVPELACLVRPYVGRLGGRAASRKLRKMIGHGSDHPLAPRNGSSDNKKSSREVQPHNSLCICTDKLRTKQ